MPDKEATARIKINKLLEAAGWRFFREGDAPANIRPNGNLHHFWDLERGNPYVITSFPTPDSLSQKWTSRFADGSSRRS